MSTHRHGMFLLRLLIQKPAGQFYQSNLSTDIVRSQCSQSSLRTPSVESFGNPLQASTLDRHIHDVHDEKRMRLKTASGRSTFTWMQCVHTAGRREEEEEQWRSIKVTIEELRCHRLRGWSKASDDGCRNSYSKAIEQQQGHTALLSLAAFLLVFKSGTRPLLAFLRNLQDEGSSQTKNKTK